MKGADRSHLSRPPKSGFYSKNRRPAVLVWERKHETSFMNQTRLTVMFGMFYLLGFGLLFFLQVSMSDGAKEFMEDCVLCTPFSLGLGRLFSMIYTWSGNE